MNKNVTILCGVSGSGKNYISDYLTKHFGFIPLISHTTRIKRPNETNGVDYHFISEEQFLSMIEDEYFIEYRTYNTLVNNIPATWYYGLAKQPLEVNNQYVVILDMQGTRDFIKWYGADKCNVVMITCDADIRRRRAITRGGYDKIEFNRRLEDDAKKFSISDHIDIIDCIVENDGRWTIEEICEFILDNINSDVV